MTCPRCSQPLASTGECPRCGGEVGRGSAGPRPDEIFAGRYRIAGVIGTGGMGVVYRARDLILGEDVALKVIRPEYLDHPTVEKRFAREVALARKLAHHNICRIHDLGEAKGLRFISMQLLEGTSLDDYLVERGPLSPSRVIGVTRQLLSALHEAHQKGVIHRDIKPRNVLFTRQGEAVLMDFGIAKRMELLPVDGETTVAGVTLGTPGYMAPEIVQGAEATPLSDLYALGATVFKLLVGRLPFEGKTALDIFRQQMQGEAPAIDPLCPGVSPLLSRFVARALRREPAERYPGAAAALYELDQDPIATAVTGVHSIVPAGDGGAVRPASRKLWLAAILPVLLAAAGLVVAVRAMRSRPADPSLVILPFHEGPGIGDLQGAGSLIADMLITSLGRAPGLRVVSRLKLESALNRLGTASPAPEAVAAATGARRIVTGMLVRGSGRLRLEAQVIDAGSGNVTATATGELAEGAGLFELVDRVAEDLIDDVGGGEAPPAVSSLTTASLPAYRAYDRALRAFGRGELTAARGAFEEAVGVDPDFALAWSRLASVSEQLGLREQARRAVDQALKQVDRLSPAERELVRASARLHEKRYDAAAAHLQRYLKRSPHDTLALYTLAECEIGRRAYDRAIEILEECIDADPDFAVAYERLGEAYRARRAWDDALSWFERQAASNPRSPLPYLGAGITRLERHEVDQAEAAFRRALDIDGHLAPALVGLGEAALARRDMKAARERFDAALAAEPGSLPALAGKGRLALVMRHYDQALHSFEELLLRDRQNREGLLGVGRVHLQRRALDEARAWFERATEVDPYFTDGYLSLGKLALEERQFDQAMRQFDRAAAVDPYDLRPLLSRGQAQRLLGRLDAARAAAEEARRRDPYEVEALNLLGLIEDDRRNFEKSALAYEQAVKVDRYFTYGYNNLGVVKARLHQYQQALARLEEAAALDPYEPLTYANLGIVSGLSGDEAAAEHWFARAREVDRFDTGVYIAESGVLRQLGHSERALAALRPAQALNPLDERIFYERGQSLRLLKREAEARASFEQALAIKPRFLEAALALGGIEIAAGEGERASRRFEALVEPGDAPAALRIGGFLLRSGEKLAGRAWIRRALAADQENPWVAYDAARAAADGRDREEALRLLAVAVERGIQEPNLISGDPSFQDLRGDPRFVELVGRVH